MANTKQALPQERIADALDYILKVIDPTWDGRVDGYGMPQKRTRRGKKRGCSGSMPRIIRRCSGLATLRRIPLRRWLSWRLWMNYASWAQRRWAAMWRTTCTASTTMPALPNRWTSLGFRGMAARSQSTRATCGSTPAPGASTESMAMWT